MVLEGIQVRGGKRDLGDGSGLRERQQALAPGNPEMAVTAPANAPGVVGGIFEQIGVARRAGQIDRFELVWRQVNRVGHGLDPGRRSGRRPF
jgi:hypothetical protein